MALNCIFKKTHSSTVLLTKEGASPQRWRSGRCWRESDVAGSVLQKAEREPGHLFRSTGDAMKVSVRPVEQNHFVTPSAPQPPPPLHPPREANEFPRETGMQAPKSGPGNEEISPTFQPLLPSAREVPSVKICPSPGPRRCHRRRVAARLVQLFREDIRGQQIVTQQGWRPDRLDAPTDSSSCHLGPSIWHTLGGKGSTGEG